MKQVATRDKKLELGSRPKCSTEGCSNECQFTGYFSKEGNPRFRSVCSKCHNKKIADKHGMSSIMKVLAKNSGHELITSYLDDVARKNGYANRFEQSDAKHEYRRYRKMYCENAEGQHAGWLGFTCTNTIVHPYLQLEVDHSDGDPRNNDPENLMTLCGTCHSIKTNMFMDTSTTGRKGVRI